VRNRPQPLACIRYVAVWTVMLGLAAAFGCSRPSSDQMAPGSRSARNTQDAEPRSADDPPAGLTLRSSAFRERGEIPSRYTCTGKNVSPPLAWSDIPPGTQSLALIVDDPDAPDPKAPQRVWVHWVVFNLPPTTSALPEAVAPLPQPAKHGLNDWKRAAYGGPCPPIGRHRYFHKLYALDTVLALDSPTKAELEKAMQGHVLGKAELVGTYQKP
jgi:Raf kinase inhibitor-like YbhB/YbcL family protein